MRKIVLNFFLIMLKYTNKINSFIFINKIKKLPKLQSISLVDIGSSFDIQPRWKKIKKVINYHGFEPNKDLKKEIENKNSDCLSYNIYPYLISDQKGKKNFNICENPGVSSVLEPNYSFLDKFKDSSRFKIIEEDELDTNFLDNLKLKNIDFLKIDIQGYEMNALKGSIETLKDVIGLEIEVEFQKMYQNQPLFGEIDKFICENDFEFIDFPIIKRWERNNINSFGQVVFADALYLRSPEFANKNFDENKMIRYLLILILYNKFDLVKICDLKKFYTESEIKTIKKIVGFFEKKDNIARFISSISTGFSKILGDEYKSHLFH